MTRKKNASAAAQAAASGAGVSNSFDPPTAAGDGIPGTYHDERAPAPSSSHVGDPWWGRGGRYIVGADGVRRPATQQE